MATYVYLTLAGLAVGWMVGMSASPVVQTVLATTLALASAIVSALAGLPHSAKANAENQETPISGEAKATVDQKPNPADGGTPPPGGVGDDLQPKINPAPLAVFALSLAIGSGFGIISRTREWFGSEVHLKIQQWRKTGLSDEQIANRIFDNEYPSNAPAPLETRSAYWKSTGLPTKQISKLIFEAELGKFKPQESEKKTADGQSGSKEASSSNPNLRPALNTELGFSETNQIRSALGDPPHLRLLLRATDIPALIAYEKQCRDDSDLVLAIRLLVLK